MNKLNSYSLVSCSLLVLICSFLAPKAIADKLTVRAGQTGYLGELYPMVFQIYKEYHPSGLDNGGLGKYPELPPNATYMQFANIGTGSINSTFPKYQGAPGLILVNENDRNNAIILLLNGTVSAKFVNSMLNRIVKTAKIEKSRTVSGDLYQTEYLGWKLENNSKAIKDYFYGDSDYVRRYSPYISANISSFSAYASTPNGGESVITKGRYVIPNHGSLQFGYQNLYSFAGWGAADSKLLTDNTLSVEALDSCSVTPLTSTNIRFPDQLAGGMSTRLLDTQSATMSINCINTGKLLMVLSANQRLYKYIGSSDVNPAGTILEPISGNSTSLYDKPFIVTSMKPPSANICRMGDPDALKYYDRIPLGNVKNTNTSFTQTLYFNLCQGSSVTAGGYKGSIDVSFYLE